jgi:hypothetical protein
MFMQRHLPQATAFSLATVLTLGVMSTLNLLATAPAQAGLQAAGSNASQTVTSVPRSQPTA